MTTEIYSAIYRHFKNYEYQLVNSYVYDWESDFFAMSKSRYFIEVEVKISRADYFADFKKDKHELFKDVSAGKTHHITHQPTKGDLIGRVIHGVLSTRYGDEKHGRLWRGSMHNGKWGYWVNDYGDIWIAKHEHALQAPATSIQIRPIDKIKCPNQFYYACPAGLIKLNELPPYAGLIEICDGGKYLGQTAVIIKKAPYMHKTKQDMHRTLLQKFYNLWKYKTPFKDKIEVMSQKQISI